MVNRKYSTTEKRVWQSNWFWLAVVLSFFHLTFYSWAWVAEKTALKPSDFPDLSHEVVEVIQAKEDEIKAHTGIASWYDYSLPNYPNYSQNNFTAASRDYPRGTKLRVCRGDWENFLEDKEWFQSDRCIEVRVNDYVENPDVIIDLSSAAFRELATLSRGLVEVKVFKID